MAQLSDIKTYIEQWVKTATQGNVTVDYAWFQDRMEMRCKKCHAIFRCNLPDCATSIDWHIQSWVNKHVPDGVHDKEEAPPLAPTPVTADFKLLSSAYQSKAFGNIDESSLKAETIKTQMEKYKAEQSAKDLDKKVEWLKKTEAQKAEVSKAQDEKAKEQALQNLLNLMVNMGISEGAANALSKLPSKKPLPVEPEDEWEDPEPALQVTKLKKAVIAVGRRFR